MNEPKSIEDFRLKHDPTYVILSPTTVFERPLPKDAKHFIITAAQNATPIHKAWWATLERIAAHVGAEILVIPLRYKNPTSHWSGSQQNAEHWDAAVRPYLWNVRKPLNVNLTVLADIKTQPTASDPLSGFDAVSLASSGIVGHTKLRMRSVATPGHRMAKILTTTGACTVANYTDSKVGKIGEFHHSLSAVLVRIDGKRFHLRHLHFDGEGCSDLDTYYTPKSTGRAPQPLALAMGDTHVDAIDPKVEAATFGSGGMAETLKPKHLIWHDLLDGYSCNPHHAGDPFIAFAKRAKSADDVRAELNRAIAFVGERTPPFATSIIVPSNHNDFLRRWVVANDWRRDPVNGEFYLETALAMVRGAKLTGRGTEYPDPFSYWFRAANVPRSRVLNEDESFLLAGVECGMHGDVGPNGSRGSIKNLRRIGVKSIIGHAHSPGIDEGCYQVGTSTWLRLEYNHGASSWLNAHCLLHASGKRQIVTIVDGEWR